MMSALQGELPSGLQRLMLYPRTNGERVLGLGVFVEETLRPRSLRLVALRVSPSKLPPRAEVVRSSGATGEP